MILTVSYTHLDVYKRQVLTGLAQCAELCWQLRGLAGKRQMKGARVALQHNIGLGGAVIVALYRLGFPGAQQRYTT